MYKCFIIDDEQHAIQTLIKYATDSGLLEVIGSTQNPLEGIKLINAQKNIDITFLDIDMPEISGLDAADLIYDNTAIVFTTGHSGYAVQGFEKNISDFLLKPISFEKFLKSINKVIARLEEKQVDKEEQAEPNKSYFFVNPGIKGKMLKINYQDVEVVEALNNYIVIHTEQGKQIIYLTMKEIEAGLPQESFIRIHKSFMININKVSMMEGNKITVGKRVLPIGSSFKDKLLKKINSNMIKTQR